MPLPRTSPWTRPISSMSSSLGERRGSWKRSGSDSLEDVREGFVTKLQNAHRRTSENSVKKLSEKSRRSFNRRLPGHRSGTIRHVWGPIYRPNPHSERRSNPFSDSFKAKFAEYLFHALGCNRGVSPRRCCAEEAT